MEMVAARSADGDSSDAGRDLGSQIAASLSGHPDALIVFAAPQHDHRALLRALNETCRPALMVGASSAGEFVRRELGEGTACALALRGGEMRFSAAVGRDVSDGPAAAAREIAADFRGTAEQGGYRSALVLSDVLAGYASELLDELTFVTAGRYEFFGGGAGDNAQFRRTPVFYGTDVLTDAAVALEIVSDKPLGIGVAHGWEPAGQVYRVTEAFGLKLIGLNGFPALEAFQAHAEAIGQRLDPADPIPFFLHNVIGIESAVGYKLRVPLAVDAEGGITCAAEIPAGSRVRIMRSTAQSAAAAAERATQAALARLAGNPAKACLFFDCVATRLRLGTAFASELDAVGERLAGVDLVGCNTHGQIVRAEGQFDGFHNCTAVVCVLPG